MFKESFERGGGEVIESEISMQDLKQRLENESLSLDERIQAADKLIERYKKLEATTQDVLLKIDRAEAETIREHLLADSKRGEIDLDFTKPGSIEGIEVTELFEPIAEEVRAIKKKVQEVSSANDSGYNDFDNALRATGEYQAADRLDARRKTA